VKRRSEGVGSTAAVGCKKARTMWSAFFFISGIFKVAGESGLLFDPFSGFSANAPFGVFDPVREIYGGVPFQDIAACIAKFGHCIVLQGSYEGKARSHDY